MILALPEEFFKDWAWKEGDCFLTPRITINNSVFGPITYEREIHYVGEFKLLNDDLIQYHECDELIDYQENVFDLSKVTPIPNQEQLQKKSKLGWDLYYHDLIKRYSNYDTAEQAGLAMIMYTKYGKKWNGETWI